MRAPARGTVRGHRIPASGSSAWASKPAETSTSSGREARDGRLDRVVEGAQVLLVARPGRQRDVQRRLAAARAARRCRDRTATGAARRRGRSGRPRRSPAVPLPWWTSQSTIATRSSAELGLRAARRDGDVVEEAEAHRALGGARGGRAAGRARSRRARAASIARPAASSAASKLVSDASVSPSSHVGAVDARTWLDVRRRRGSARRRRRSQARLAPVAEIARAAPRSRSGVSGWCPVGWSVGERRVAHDLDGGLRPAARPSRPARFRGPTTATRATPPPTSGSGRTREGRGAEASSVAIRR